ncbi:helix-turn-helix domain-containing protein [Nocardia sp. CDC159]|uniref:Helix-turn-helix domain-containing protein n=1 Tax=Nocardia pulmonis TaxID=2951408 RepID=A0A9X2IVK5_9NOCA|nr:MULTISPECIES: helix-turn-helix domain-containing protein [Nocardia]MCM6771895.1 helix-turn-helix domain-containing protein [Nocardia pulmonis]MCM6785447.1 helix-turn-helix domain-containing protein [Nocardia sp. CDC159]
MRCSICPDSTWEWASARPHPRLSPGVLGYRGFRFDLEKGRRRWDAPDGVVSLWLFDENLSVRLAGHRGGGRIQGPAIGGLRTGARVSEHNGRLAGVEVMLEPWAAYSLFSDPMYELADRLVAPRGRVRELAERLTETRSWAERFALVDATLLRWFEHAPRCAPQIEWAWRLLAASGGTIPIRRLADRTGWGWRQLDNRFREQIGLSPKTAARVLRLRRTLFELDRTAEPAAAAMACGFSDQAHLSREMRAMVGRTPRQHLAARALVTREPAWHRACAAATTTLSDLEPAVAVANSFNTRPDIAGNVVDVTQAG